VTCFSSVLSVCGCVCVCVHALSVFFRAAEVKLELYEPLRHTTAAGQRRRSVQWKRPAREKIEDKKQKRRREEKKNKDAGAADIFGDERWTAN
jgi:hypothetical protein